MVRRIYRTRNVLLGSIRLIRPYYTLIITWTVVKSLGEARTKIGEETFETKERTSGEPALDTVNSIHIFCCILKY